MVSKNSEHPAKPIQNWNSNGANFGVDVLGFILMVLGVQIFADFSLLRCEKPVLGRLNASQNAPETFQDAKKPPQDITQDASEEPNLGLWRRRYGELTGGVQRDALRRGTRRRGTRPWWRRSRHHIYARGFSGGPGLGKSKSFLSHS